MAENNDMSEKNNIQTSARTICERLKTIEQIYDQLIQAEHEKQHALLNRNPQILQQLVQQQEDLLRDSRYHENLLDIELQNLACLTDRSDLRLSEIDQLREIPQTKRSEIQRLRLKLSEMGATLQNLALANQKILQDNVEILRSLAEHLSREPVSGYGTDKRSVASRRPVLVNAAG